MGSPSRRSGMCFSPMPMTITPAFSMRSSGMRPTAGSFSVPGASRCCAGDRTPSPAAAPPGWRCASAAGWPRQGAEATVSRRWRSASSPAVSPPGGATGRANRGDARPYGGFPFPAFGGRESLLRRRGDERLSQSASDHHLGGGSPSFCRLLADHSPPPPQPPLSRSRKSLSSRRAGPEPGFCPADAMLSSSTDRVTRRRPPCGRPPSGYHPAPSPSCPGTAATVSPKRTADTWSRATGTRQWKL